MELSPSNAQGKKLRNLKIRLKFTAETSDRLQNLVCRSPPGSATNTNRFDIVNHIP